MAKDESGVTAVLDKEEDVKEPDNPYAQYPNVHVKHPERLYRTVLFGYGKPVSKIQRIDYTVFENGVARNVHRDTVQCWLDGTRPKGTKRPYAMDGEVAYSSVDIIVLDDDATEADIARITGVVHGVHIPISKVAALLKTYSAKDLVAALGKETTDELINSLKKANQ